MTQLECAYAAGVLDSDGCIYLYVAVRKNKPGTVEYRGNVGVSQAEPEAVQLLQQLFGGSIRLNQRRTPTNLFKSTPRPLWEWKLAGAQSVRCIEAVLPMLRIKKAQGQLLLEFETLRRGTTPTDGKARSQEARQRLDSMVKRMGALNSRKSAKVGHTSASRSKRTA